MGLGYSEGRAENRNTLGLMPFIYKLSKASVAEFTSDFDGDYQQKDGEEVSKYLLFGDFRKVLKKEQ